LNGDMSGPFKIGSKPFEPPFDKDAHGNPINNSILSEVVIGKVNFDSTKSTVAPVSQSNLYESTDSFFPIFHTWFKPTHPGNPDKGGAYGFRITGTVSYGASSYDCQGKLKHPHDAQIPAGTVEVDEYFVCRGGTQAPPEEMSCVMQQVTFPGTQQDGYSANAPLSGARVVKVSPKYVPVWH
jgi:hypothetical protein